jgi:hypothetical protein
MATRIRSWSVRLSRRRALAASRSSSHRQASPDCVELSSDLLERDALARVEAEQGAVDLAALLLGEGLVVRWGGLQPRHGGIADTLQPLCRRLEGGVGQAVNQVVEICTGHALTVPAHDRVQRPTLPRRGPWVALWLSPPRL